VRLVAAITRLHWIAGQSALVVQPPLSDVPAVGARRFVCLDRVAGGFGVSYRGVEVRADGVLPLAGHVLEGVKRVPEGNGGVGRFDHRLTLPPPGLKINNHGMTETLAPLRVGFIGCGPRARVAHLPSVARLQQEGAVTLVSLCDLDEQRLAASADYETYKNTPLAKDTLCS
jgi:hypothetical protein